MSNSQCTSCGRMHQSGQCHIQNSTTPFSQPIDVTPACCCNCYLYTICFSIVIILFSVGLSMISSLRGYCYVELFANSVSVSNANANANVSVADWTIGFAARSPITNCKMSFQTLKSRLLRGDQVISNSLPPMSEYIGQFVAGDMANVVFEKVVMPELVIGDVIWDFRVEVKYAMHINAGDVTVLVMAVCPDIPVKFTTDSAGNMMGSLLGNMRRCDYIIQDQLLNPLRS